MSKALIVVDVQKDFCENGSLAVAGGNDVAHRIAKHIDEHWPEYEAIVFTKDWHRPDSDNGGHFSDTPDFVDTWPAHCVAGTRGSELHDALPGTLNSFIFHKGNGKPSYSGFEGSLAGVPLDDFLLSIDVTRLDVCGIAGDYCVRATAADALGLGYDVNLMLDCIASVGGTQATMVATRALDKIASGGISVFDVSLGII